MRDIFVDHMDTNKYFWARYDLTGKVSLRDAARELAIGQSIGNPNAVSVWETDDMIEDFAAKVYIPNESRCASITSGMVWIGFPYSIIDFRRDGITQLLCILMGGQMDIDNIIYCRLEELLIPKLEKISPYPYYGISGLRDRMRRYDRPLLGGIVKPKTGITPETLLEMVKAMVYGGVDFIKEDEILGNPEICPFEARVDLIGEWLYRENSKVVYAACINGDPMSAFNKYDYIADRQGDPMGVHLNVWGGLGMYRDLRNKNGGVFIHYQKSGDKTFTTGMYSINWKVICYLASLCGVDSIHAGMLYGYLSDDEADMLDVVKILRKRNVIPALSCGMSPEKVAPITEKIGVDWMANVGGFIHSDPNGTEAGTYRMRMAIDNIKGS